MWTKMLSGPRKKPPKAIAVIDPDRCFGAVACSICQAQLDCDFYVFSGHKLFGPTGGGVLYGKAALLDAMPPYQGGGDMISSVTFEKTQYNVVPYKFEAGTPNITGAIGLGAAIDYLTGIDHAQMAAYEHDLLAYGTEALLPWRSTTRVTKSTRSWQRWTTCGRSSPDRTDATSTDGQETANVEPRWEV